jgi:hypothetical protein
MIRFKEFISEARTERVNRIRHGKIQKRVLVSRVPGYKVEDGRLVKMSYQEIRHREVAQRKAARKRKAMMNQIVRKMKMSLRKRKTAGFNK